MRLSTDGKHKTPARYADVRLRVGAAMTDWAKRAPGALETVVDTARALVGDLFGVPAGPGGPGTRP